MASIVRASRRSTNNRFTLLSATPGATAASIHRGEAQDCKVNRRPMPVAVDTAIRRSAKFIPQEMATNAADPEEEALSFLDRPRHAHRSAGMAQALTACVLI